MARTSQYPPSVDPGVPKEWPTPPGWSRARFRDLVDVVERPVELRDDAEYQLVIAKRNRGGIVARERALGKSIRVKSQYRIEAGDFLMSARQIIHGACGVVPAKLAGAIVSNEYVVLRPRVALATAYLRQLSYTPYFQRTCFHSSVGVDVEKMVFKVERWLDYSVSIPPVDEQLRIASTLGAVDESIGANTDHSKLVHDAMRALIADLISRGSPSRRAQTKATPLGDMPAHWRVATLGGISHLSSGSTPSRRNPAHFTREDGCPWVKTLDLNDGLVVRTEEQVTELGLSSISCRMLSPGTVLVAMYGGFGQIGRSGVLSMPAVTNQALCALTLVGADVDPRFVNVWLIANRWRWRSIAASSRKDPNITRRDVEAFPIAVPPQEEQRDIIAAWEACSQLVGAAERSVDALRLLKEALSAQLLCNAKSVR